MTDVEKSEISFIMSKIMVFCCILRCFVAKRFFFAIYAVFRKIGLLQFTHYCVEKILVKISDRGEKMTNMKYVPMMLFSAISHSPFGNYTSAHISKDGCTWHAADTLWRT